MAKSYDKDDWRRIVGGSSRRKQAAIRQRIDTFAMASEAQVKYLISLGVPEKEARSMTKAGASKKIDELKS